MYRPQSYVYRQWLTSRGLKIITEIPPDIPADKRQDKHSGMDHLTTWFDILPAVDHFPNLF